MAQFLSVTDTTGRRYLINVDRITVIYAYHDQPNMSVIEGDGFTFTVKADFSKFVADLPVLKF